MEITIQCPCGTPYVFDIEPVNGRMPTGVNCPTCGADGEELANEFIQQQLAAQPPTPPADGLRNPLPENEPRSRVRISAPASGAVTHNQGPDAVPPLPNLRQPVQAEPNLLLGAAGAAGAACAGMLAWYLLVKVTEYELGIVAWGIGALTGVAALALGRQASAALGWIAGACALIAILGGQYLVAKSFYDEFVSEVIDGAYESHLALAQDVLKAGSDQELKVILAEYYADEGETPDPGAISDANLEEFRREDLPTLEDLAAGRTSKTAHQANLRRQFNEFSGFTGLLGASVSLWTVLWLFLGVGTAYRLASRRQEETA